MQGHRPLEQMVDEPDDARHLRPQPIAHLPHRLPHEILPDPFRTFHRNPPFILNTILNDYFYKI